MDVYRGMTSENEGEPVHLLLSTQAKRDCNRSSVESGDGQLYSNCSPAGPVLSTLISRKSVCSFR